MKIKTFLPWWLKIFAKVILSRVPASYLLWQRLNLFKHGSMERPEYAFYIFNRHFERFNCGSRGRHFSVLELGPGDSLATAILASAYGGDAVYLVDNGPFARRDTAPYAQMMALIKEKGLHAPVWTESQSMQELMTKCNAHYGTEGLNSLKRIPTGTIDFIFSHAVLEHVRKSEFIETMRELRRIIKADGICSHSIDLKDHLGGALNNLRFSERLWESEFMAGSGFYTNRIRYQEMLDIFSDVGFSVDIINEKRWGRLPIKRSALASEFSSYGDAELLVSDFDVVLRPRNFL